MDFIAHPRRLIVSPHAPARVAGGDRGCSFYNSVALFTVFTIPQGIFISNAAHIISVRHHCP
jgi:hypothetical protein